MEGKDNSGDKFDEIVRIDGGTTVLVSVFQNEIRQIGRSDF